MKTSNPVFSGSKSSLKNKLKNLTNFISKYSSAIVAYSGGVDSTIVAALTNEVLGSVNSLIITGKSPSINPRELEFATKLAQDRKWNHKIIETNEFLNSKYRKNDLARCFYCKFELYSLLDNISESKNYEVVFNGTNSDDLIDYRPGIKAANNINVVSPLSECEINKNDVREIAKSLNLVNWDKPSQPCLSSRVPYGTEITMNILNQISDAENYLSDLGFSNFRVRNHGSVARIELSESDIIKIIDKELRYKINTYIKKLGFQYVSLDLIEFKSGNLNTHLNKKNS